MNAAVADANLDLPLDDLPPTAATVAALKQEIARLKQSRDSLRTNNQALSKSWNNLEGAQRNACQAAAVALQYIAEKFGCAGDRQIALVIGNLQMISEGEVPEARFEFPVEFKPDTKVLSGDAEMIVDGATPFIEEVLMLLQFTLPSTKIPLSRVQKIIEGLVALYRRSLTDKIEHVRSTVGFKPIDLKPASDLDFATMTIEQLRDYVSNLKDAAYDLGQSMSSTREFLRYDLRAEAYRHIEEMAYHLASTAQQVDTGIAQKLPADQDQDDQIPF